MTMTRTERDNDRTMNATARTTRGRRAFQRLAWAGLGVAALFALAILAGLLGGQGVHAEVLPAGYIGGRTMQGELYVDGTPRPLTLPSNARSVRYAFINGSAANPSAVPVYFTMGTPTAPVPVVATPTAGNPTSTNFIDPGQPYEDIGAFRQFVFVTDGTACYLRFSIVY